MALKPFSTVFVDKTDLCGVFASNTAIPAFHSLEERAFFVICARWLCLQRVIAAGSSERSQRELSIEERLLRRLASVWEVNLDALVI